MKLCRLLQAFSIGKAVEEQELFKPLCCICDVVRFSRKAPNALFVILELIKLHVGDNALKFASLFATFFFIYTATGYSCRSFSKEVAARKTLMISI